ncbi:MAG: winged helix-turn-helix transcriptional regulator [Paludibacter sp.]|nr:winged helix-turn-helix transcriptional regulator [Paludibacter sp.]
MEEITNINDIRSCPMLSVLAINDTLNVITGKWKLSIMCTMMFGKKRFTEIQRNIPKISPRMLSKELKDLEMNGMVKRIVYDSTPVSVEYELTDSGKSIRSVLDKMLEWGLQHRESVISSL